MDRMTLDVLILLVFLVLSGFFSGSESALFSLTKADIHKYSSSKSRRGKLIALLMAKPYSILTTILIGNLFVNLVSSAISAKILLGIWGKYGHFISIMILTPIIVVFCEITPKLIALNDNVRFSKRIIAPLNLFHKLLWPVRVILIFFIDRIVHQAKLHPDKEQRITEEELDAAIMMSAKEGVINQEEGLFLKNVLRFSKKEALNVMIPRNKAVFIPYGATVKDAMKIFSQTGAVRAPVFKKDLDNIVGVLDARELLPYVLGYKKAKNINRFLYDISHYPGSKELGELLNDFLQKKIQIAVVVDEYGGTAGVVTLSSIISELIGRDHVQWENRRKPEIKKLDDYTSMISGDMQIDDFNVNFHETLASTETETVGGYVIEKLGHLPRRSEELEIENYILRVKYVRKNRIESIEVIWKAALESSKGEGE